MSSRHPRRYRAAVAVVGLVIGAAACGSTTALSASAAVVLQKDATTLSAAAGAGDRTQISAALATLRADVAQQRTAGELSADRANEILDAGARVAADAPIASPAALPTGTPATTMPPSLTPTERSSIATTSPVTQTPSSDGHGASKSRGKHGKGEGKPEEG